VILVTHQIQFIKKASKILVLKEGKPLAFGAYNELIESGIDFMSLIKEEKLEKETKNDEMTAEDFFLKEQLIRPRTLSVLSVLSKSSEVSYQRFLKKVIFKYNFQYNFKG
jgi:ABC-type transport system involved in cytochrome bd biosynthesis fused ATPase/permease subunit